MRIWYSKIKIFSVTPRIAKETKYTVFAVLSSELIQSFHHNLFLTIMWRNNNVKIDSIHKWRHKTATFYFLFIQSISHSNFSNQIFLRILFSFIGRKEIDLSRKRGHWPRFGRCCCCCCQGSYSNCCRRCRGICQL